MKPIQVLIEIKYDHAHIQNLWEFLYEVETRSLYLCSYRKFVKFEEQPWTPDYMVLAEVGQDNELKLKEALGEPDSYDRLKVEHIARAKAMESDPYMKYNEANCSSIEMWDPYKDKSNG